MPISTIRDGFVKLGEEREERSHCSRLKLQGVALQNILGCDVGTTESGLRRMWEKASASSTYKKGSQIS